MSHMSPEQSGTSESHKDESIRVLLEMLASQEWQQRGKGLSMFGNGDLNRWKFAYAKNNAHITESRIDHYWRRKLISSSNHSVTFSRSDGVDAEGGHAALHTEFVINMEQGGDITVSQEVVTPTKHDQAVGYPHYGIDTATTDVQWQELHRLLTA